MVPGPITDASVSPPQARREPQAPDATLRTRSIPQPSASRVGGGEREKEGVEEGRTREGREARELSEVSVCVYPDRDRAVSLFKFPEAVR